MATRYLKKNIIHSHTKWSLENSYRLFFQTTFTVYLQSLYFFFCLLKFILQTSKLILYGETIFVFWNFYSLVSFTDPTLLTLEIYVYAVSD